MDALITFPIAVANITLQVKANIQIFGSIPFYYGWSTVHPPGWSQPVIITKEDFLAEVRKELEKAGFPHVITAKDLELNEMENYANMVRAPLDR